MLKADTLVDQAAVFIQAGQPEQAATALWAARGLYAQKMALLPLHRVDALLASVDVLLARDRATVAVQSELVFEIASRPKRSPSAATSSEEERPPVIR